MYLLIQKSDKKVLEYSGASGTTDPESTDIIKNAVDNYGGVSDDYMVFFITDVLVMKRILAGQSYEVIYKNEVPESVDFTVEENKRWLQIDVSKENVLKDGVDSVEITFSVLKQDQSGIVTTLNTNMFVNIMTPIGRVKVRLTFVNGVCVWDFKPEFHGKYIFPDKLYVGNYRVVERKIIESIMQV